MIDWLFVLQALGIFFASALVGALLGWAIVSGVMRIMGVPRSD